MPPIKCPGWWCVQRGSKKKSGHGQGHPPGITSRLNAWNNVWMGRKVPKQVRDRRRKWQRESRLKEEWRGNPSPTAKRERVIKGKRDSLPKQLADAQNDVASARCEEKCGRQCKIQVLELPGEQKLGGVCGDSGLVMKVVTNPMVQNTTHYWCNVWRKPSKGHGEMLATRWEDAVV